MAAHPAHEDLVQEVRSWYIHDYAGLGKVVERRRFGYYSQIQHTGYCDIHIVDPFDPVETPVFLADARAFYGERLVYIFTHDPAIDRRLSDVLDRSAAPAAATNYIWPTWIRVHPPLQLALGGSSRSRAGISSIIRSQS